MGSSAPAVGPISFLNYSQHIAFKNIFFRYLCMAITENWMGLKAILKFRIKRGPE